MYDFALRAAENIEIILLFLKFRTGLPRPQQSRESYGFRMIASIVRITGTLCKLEAPVISFLLSRHFCREFSGRPFTVFRGGNAFFRKKMPIKIRNVIIPNLIANICYWDISL